VPKWQREVRASLLLGGIRTKVKDVGMKRVTGEMILTRKEPNSTRKRGTLYLFNSRVFKGMSP
jgi:hypothetical protein